MALLWILLIFLLAHRGYLLGKRAARGGRRASVPVLLFCWAVLLGMLALDAFPEVEYRLLAWDGYIYLRGGLFLPIIALFVGTARGDIHRKSHRALRLFLVFLAAYVVYTYRWGLGITDYDRFEGMQDAYGICANSLPETQGAAACVTILHYYGVPVTEGWMARVTLTRSRQGASLLGLCHGLKTALEGSECDVAVERPEWEELAGRPVPGLVFLKNADSPLGRFASARAVVCIGADGAGALLASPARGLVWMSREDFLRHWNGYAITVQPPDYLKPGPEPPVWV